MTKIFEMMDVCRNHFIAAQEDGAFEIADGVLIVSSPPGCSFVAISGADVNGIWQAEAVENGLALHLDDERPMNCAFVGTVSYLNPLPQFMALANEIDAWAEQYKPTPYTSESFGAYSYSRSGGASGAGATWRDVFALQLAPWRTSMFNDLEV